MQLIELMHHTLLQLGEDIDELEEYEAIIKQYINEAYFDICRNVYKPQLIETVTLDDKGCAALSLLGMPCEGVESVEKQGARVSFRVKDGALVTSAEGEVNVRYRYLPAELKDNADVPVLPADYHFALADFAAARVLGTGSRARQSRSAFFLQRYYEARGRLQPMFRTTRFVNRY